MSSGWGPRNSSSVRLSSLTSTAQSHLPCPNLVSLERLTYERSNGPRSTTFISPADAGTKPIARCSRSVLHSKTIVCMVNSLRLVSCIAVCKSAGVSFLAEPATLLRASKRL